MQAVDAGREAFAHKAAQAMRQVGYTARTNFQKGASLVPGASEEEAEEFTEDHFGSFEEQFMQGMMQGRAGQMAGMGMGGGLLGRILTIVVVPIVLLIGLVIYGNFNSALDTSSLSTDAQNAINNTNSNAYSGFDLAAILPLVLAGVAILSIVIGAFAFGLSGRRR